MKTTLLPVTNKTDLQLVKKIKTSGDNDSFVEVCRRYENVFYKICQKYINALSMSGVNPQDIFDEKNFIIFHCVSTFKPNKNTKLSTWIGNYARYLCLNSINARRFILPSTNEDVQRYIEESQTKNDYLSSLNSSQEDYDYILNILKQLKDDRIIEIFNHRYCSNKKIIWSNIAKKMNISTQTAINLHNKGLELIRKKIKSKNISDQI